MTLAIVFPNQGSQSLAMLAELAEAYSGRIFSIGNGVILNDRSQSGR